MSSGQSGLGKYGVAVPQPGNEDDDPVLDHRPKLGFESVPTAPSLTDEVAAARNVDWVVFTGRYPYVFDAARLGFGVGHREDSPFQWTPDEVRLPVHFLDNDYMDSDLNRFVQRVFDYQPEIAVLGDIYNSKELEAHLQAADEIWGSYPEMELMLVPKCGEVLGDIPSEFIVGYANGASPIQAMDVASHREWRETNNRLHILGGTPLSTYDEIVTLTKEWVTGEPPADIAGVDWNGYQRYAENHGDYAAADGGWHRNLRSQYVPKRDLIRYSLLNAKHFWISKGVWPNADVNDLPTRSDLLEANLTGSISLNDQSDRRELALSPPPSNDRHATPIYRTDSTQAEIQEPLSPLASLLATVNWFPDGTFDGKTTYRTPQAHRTEPTCTGCGAHILAEPEECAGAGLPHRSLDEQPTLLTFQVVSYEHQTSGQTNDYESVTRQGPSALQSARRFPRIHTFCSESCRCRAEGQSPDLLLGDHPRSRDGWTSRYPDGELVAKVTLAAD